jgi:hypothetical protein
VLRDAGVTCSANPDTATVLHAICENRLMFEKVKLNLSQDSDGPVIITRPIDFLHGGSKPIDVSELSEQDRSRRIASAWDHCGLVDSGTKSLT